MICNNCDLDIKPIVIPCENSPHDAKLICPGCSQFLGFQKKDKNKRTTSKIKIDIDYCQICLRKKYQFGFNETQHQHHVQEIQYQGLDTQENIWTLCTRCHNLIHFLRDLSKNV